MLRYAAIFFVLALVAAILGFGGIAGAFAWAAEVAFWAFVVLFGLTLVANLFRTAPA